MQFTGESSKTHAYPCLKSLIFISSSLCFVYFLLSLVFAPTPRLLHLSDFLQDASSPTTLEHIVFGIASNQISWPNRKEYVRLWWRPSVMRGCVFLDSSPPPNSMSDNDTASLPPICISEDTSRFQYTHRSRLRSAIRVARVMSETVALNHSDVRWFVFGDDDTVFFPENLVKTLSKYDHRLWFYIGTNSEMYSSNQVFSFEMAFGGAGLAISYPLARVLAKVFDPCIERYPHVFGSDSRIFACLAELGVGLTREPGFHQLDIGGNIQGLLAAHPVSPLVSLHHIGILDPIFPNMTPIQALEHLVKAANFDPHRILQQTVCYDKLFSWTVSVSWGYVVQVYEHNLCLSDAIRAEETFRPWNTYGFVNSLFSFDTRGRHPDPCHRPAVYFLDNVTSGGDGIKSIYKLNIILENCNVDKASPRRIQEVKVFSQKLHLDTKQLQAPRRHCCDVLPSSALEVMEVAIRECQEEELIYMNI